MPNYTKNYQVVFVDENGIEHKNGEIIGTWYESRDDSFVDEPVAEFSLSIFKNLNEIDSVLKALAYYKAVANGELLGVKLHEFEPKE